MSPGKLIPPELIEEIKQRNEIVSVVEKYVHLNKKSAQNLFGLCPFHSEDTPSFSVSPGKQIYYCFGCHKGGDVVHFIMDIEKVGYYDSLRLLAEKSGIALPESDDREYRKKSDLRKLLLEMNTEAARFYYKTLISPQGKTAQDYLVKRGIDAGTIRKFGLGYAPDDWEGLYRHLRGKGYDETSIFLTGLFKKREKNISQSNTMYDLLRGRLIFPIFDYLGRIVAFGGRVLDDSIPKYINSPETPIYIKGRHLYGFNKAKASKEKKLLIVEGYMDAIAIHQAGIDYAVASLGTALTEQQAMLARNYSDEVIISYDADIAGQAATMRGLDILKRKGCKVSVLVLPEAKDPDEYIRKNGAERFRALIGDAMPLMDYKLFAAYKASMKSGRFDKIGYQNLACDILASEENIVIKEIYASTVADKLGVSLDNVLAETRRRIDAGSKPKSREASPAAPITEQENFNEDDQGPELFSATKEELYLLCVLSYAPSVYRGLKSRLDYSYFSPGLMQKIAEEAEALCEKGKLTAASLLALGADHVVNGRKLSELFASGCMRIGEISDSREAETEAFRLYVKMQIRLLLDAKEAATAAVSMPETSPEEKEAARQKIRSLTNDINELKSKL
ncbi:MAG: DNA primase [Saccharofermentanales bacterium]